MSVLRSWDIEGLLGWVETSQAAVATLLNEDDLKVRPVAVPTQELRQYLRDLTRVRDAICDSVVDSYGVEVPIKAAALYRPLLQLMPSWLRELPDLGSTIPFFTLNYDPAVESAISLLQERRDSVPGLRLIDGLRDTRGATGRHWHRAAFEEYAPDQEHTDVVLVKLHGSVRWGRSVDRISELQLGVNRDPGRFKHAILDPTLLPKALDLEPFHTGYRLLDRCLLSARVLVVIGSSLRDKELGKAIADGFDDNANLHLLVIGPHAHHEEIATQLQLDSARVAALQAYFELPEDPYQVPLIQGLRPLILEACGAARDAGRPRYGTTYLIKNSGLQPVA
jgi:hypothetical protein